MIFNKYYFFFIIFVYIHSCAQVVPKKQYDTSRILAYEVNPKTENLQFFWKNKAGDIYGNAQNLKTQLEARGKTLTFAMKLWTLFMKTP